MEARSMLGWICVLAVALAAAGCTTPEALAPTAAAPPTAAVDPTAAVETTVAVETTAAVQPTAAVDPTAALTASPTFTPEPEPAFSRVTVPEVGLVFEVPADWAQLAPDWAWTPAEGSDVRLGFKAAELVPPQEIEALMLPSPATVLGAEELMPRWGSGRLFTVEVYGEASGSEQAPVIAVELHALFAVEMDGTRQAFDFYATAPDAAQAAAQREIVLRMVESVAFLR